MADEGFFFTVYMSTDKRIHGYVKASDKEEAIRKIKDADFDIIHEDDMGGDYDWDTLDVEDNK